MPTGKRGLDPAILGLAVLLVVQLAVVLNRQTMRASPDFQPVIAGVSLNDIQAIGPAGAEPAVDGPTLLLAFHSECAHCLRVSPQWAEWLRTHGSDRVIAISREELDVAARYASEQDWSVLVRSIPTADLRGLETALLSRTPWIYVVDADGIVQAAGHGNRIEELGALFEDLVHSDGKRMPR
jgi:hypothetical protein